MTGDGDSVRYMDALTIERFWNSVDKRGPDECWPWMKGRHSPSYGYGVFYIQRKKYTAHRLALTLSVGPPPEGMHALHSCDNPPCCNPAHLRWGTHVDNMRDMEQRGRANGPNAGKTHCVHGHALDGDNLILKPNRRVRSGIERVCRQCYVKRTKQGNERRKSRREAASAAREKGKS